MRRIIQCLVLSGFAFFAASALAQSPMFPTVQPVKPYGSGPYVNFYNAGGANVFLPPGVGLQFKPLPPQYRQPLPTPNRSYYNGPYNYPATAGYGSSPYIRPYGGAGTGY
jgi:hypothetical protein